MTEPPPILLVEDDPEIRELVVGLLTREGLAAQGLGDAAALDDALTTVSPALIILDVMLPGEDGLSICRRLRAESDVPILMLTAKGDEIDRIVGLEIGADDYLPKPFHPRELLARIRALLRRAQSRLQARPQGSLQASRQGAAPDPAAPFGDAIRFAGFQLETAARRVLDPSGAPIELSSAEFDLLTALAQAAGRVLSRDQLLDRVFGRAGGPYDRSIDVLISRLRKKIEATPDRPQLIKTVRGAGYTLAARAESARGEGGP